MATTNPHQKASDSAYYTEVHLEDPGNGMRSGNHHHVAHTAGSILGSARVPHVESD